MERRPKETQEKGENEKISIESGDSAQQLPVNHLGGQDLLLHPDDLLYALRVVEGVHEVRGQPFTAPATLEPQDITGPIRRSAQHFDFRISGFADNDLTGAVDIGVRFLCLNGLDDD